MPPQDTTAGNPLGDEPATEHAPAGCARALGLGCGSGVAGAVLGAVASLVFLALSSRKPSPEPIAFDSAAWRSPDRFHGGSFEHPLRQRMAGDLVDHLLAPGASRAHVRELLGPPSRWPVFDASPWFGAEDEAWWLGWPTGAFSEAHQWLVLDFDAHDTLRSARIVDEGAARRARP